MRSLFGSKAVVMYFEVSKRWHLSRLTAGDSALKTLQRSHQGNGSGLSNNTVLSLGAIKAAFEPAAAPAGASGLLGSNFARKKTPTAVLKMGKKVDAFVDYVIVFVSDVV
ncbi:UNVERIFIED_CONTAM: hypothetical protein HDU68_009396 [Siphonaria sp. JEL0065]|nr:hypothetical protein HDU68_009396 [Siphonaria sp. JEL0065]